MTEETLVLAKPSPVPLALLGGEKNWHWWRKRGAHLTRTWMTADQYMPAQTTVTICQKKALEKLASEKTLTKISFDVTRSDARAICEYASSVWHSGTVWQAGTVTHCRESCTVHRAL